MRGALIHGVLLVVMLVYGYRTWTRDKTVQPDFGAVVLWEKSESDLTSLELKSENKIVKLERRGQGGESYWWGSETNIEKRPKPKAPEPPKPAEAPKPAAGEGSGSAAKPAGAGSAAKAPEPPKPADAKAGDAKAGDAKAGDAKAGDGSAAGDGSGSADAPPAIAEEEIRKTREFPIGEAAENLIKAYAKARALRDLGQPTEEQSKDYKLNEAKTTITVTFKDGARNFLLGGAVYGGSDRYAQDQQSKRVYVLSKDLISNFELGDAALHLVDPRGFDIVKMESVTIEAGGKSKTAMRVQAPGAEGQQIRTWGDPGTKKADQTVANFIDNTNNLRPTEYKPEVKVAELTQVLKLVYKDARGNHLGDLILYKRQKQGELPPGVDLDPANPPPSDTEYLIWTSKTRVPAVVRKDSAQRTEQDIVTVFSDHPTSIEPKGNPFGNAPLPPRPPPSAGSGSAAAPGGPAADPHGHGAAPGADPHGHGGPPAPTPPTPPAARAGAPGAAKPDAPKPPAAAPAPGAATPAAPKPPAAAPAPGAAKPDAPKTPPAAPAPGAAKPPAAAAPAKAEVPKAPPAPPKN
jgi:hypothetical protein